VNFNNKPSTKNWPTKQFWFISEQPSHQVTISEFVRPGSYKPKCWPSLENKMIIVDNISSRHKELFTLQNFLSDVTLIKI